MQPSPVLAAELQPVPVTWTKESEIELADRMSLQYGLNANHFRATIAGESGWNAMVQSKYLKKDGTPEKSFGLCQLNLDARPEITLEQADNPLFCLPLMAQEFSEGKAYHWSKWNEYEQEYGNGIWPEP